jgi:methionyl-tRNA formyltransferase
VRTVFLGSPPFAVPVFEALCADARTQVAALVTRPDKPRGRGMKVEESPLVRIAREHGVREHGVREHGVREHGVREPAVREHGIEVLQPERARDPAFLARLREIAPEVIVVASYGEILTQELLDLPPHGCLNVHASLLPRHRGASPIQAAILAGDAETGVSIQRMVLALDEGDVLLEERTPIGEHENAGELLARLARMGANATLRALEALASGTARFTPQDPAAATLARKIRKEHGVVAWTKSAAEIDRTVRAFTPWPGARTTAPNGAELVLLDARPRSDACAKALKSALPGTIVATSPELVVSCGEGLLEIHSVKPAGKAAMDASAWLRGARLEPGSRFGAA